MWFAAVTFIAALLYSSHENVGSIPKCFKKNVKEAIVIVHAMERMGRNRLFRRR